MLHGAGGGGWEWNLWRGVFEAEGFVVATPDLQPAPAGLAATTLDDYRRQASDALRGCGEAVVVIGASLGGLLAQMLAAESALGALVLINPLPPAPEAAGLAAAADYPAVIPWHRRARFESTRRALPDADGIAQLYAFRRWRDESGAVLKAARAGVQLAAPGCPLLLLASEHDDEVPAASSAALAARLGGSLLRVPGSHVGPLLGDGAAETARIALRWLGRVR